MAMRKHWAGIIPLHLPLPTIYASSKLVSTPKGMAAMNALEIVDMEPIREAFNHDDGRKVVPDDPLSIGTEVEPITIKCHQPFELSCAH